MKTISMINAYKDRYKTPRIQDQKPTLVPIQTSKNKKNNVKKNWAITAGALAILSTGLIFFSKFTKELPKSTKITTGILGGATIGTGAYFLFSKKSKLQKENLTENFGKRLGIMTGLGTLTTLGFALSTKDFVKENATSFKVKAPKTTLLALIALIGAVSTNFIHSVFEGIKSIFDKPDKKQNV